MGIPKLTSFIRKTSCCWTPLFLGRGSPVVIEGLGLCLRLHYGIESGDYRQFYDKVVSYFSSLKQYGLDVYVVIDGIHCNRKKTEDYRHRDIQRLRKLWDIESNVEQLIQPLEIIYSYMTMKVFIDAVRDSSVKYFVADGEGDRDIVSLANFLRCPVFGSDSDFFVFNIEGGFVPMNDNSGILVNLNGIVQCFSYGLFDSAYNLSGIYSRLPIAYCMGNDFHDSNAFPELGIERHASVETVVSKCRGIQFDDFQEKFQEDYTFYHVEPCTFKVLAQSNFLHESNPSIPEWFVANYKEGLVSAIPMWFLASENKTWDFTLAIEDLFQDSASKVIDSVLPYVTGALLSSEGTRDYVRVCRENRSFNIRDVPFKLLEKHSNVLGAHTLRNIPELSLVERRNIFLKVFHCKSVCRRLEQVPDDLKLVVVASRCWLRSINEEIDCQFNAFVIALVVCVKNCLRRSPNVVNLPPNQMGRLRRIHHLAQWEYMFHLAFIFNQILGFPFPYTSMGQFFSKSLFKKIFTSRPEYLLSRFDVEGEIMYEVITKELLPNGPVQQVRRVVAGYAPLPAISIQNRFGSLPEC